VQPESALVGGASWLEAMAFHFDHGKEKPALGLMEAGRYIARPGQRFEVIFEDAGGCRELAEAVIQEGGLQQGPGVSARPSFQGAVHQLAGEREDAGVRLEKEQRFDEDTAGIDVGSGDVMSHSQSAKGSPEVMVADERRQVGCLTP
jgi:hypothetical protein